MRNGTHRFGPGSLEDIKLVLSPSHHERYSTRNTHHVQARAEGTFRVYCGNGGEHTADIRTPAFCLGCGDLDILCDDPTAPDFLADVADAAVAWALDDWTDPCEDDPDDPDV